MADIDAAKRRDGRSTASIDEHRLGLDRVYVQTKRLADTKTVGRPEVQGFVGSLVGLGATKDDRRYLRRQQVASSSSATCPQRVIFIDSQRLADLMIEHTWVSASVVQLEQACRRKICRNAPSKIHEKERLLSNHPGQPHQITRASKQAFTVQP